MKFLLRLLFALAILGGLGYFFWQKSKDKNSVVSEMAAATEEVNMSEMNTPAADASMNYELIPRDEIFLGTDSLSKATLELIKQRYKDYFVQFVNELRADNVQVAFCWLTTEIGNSETSIQRIGKPYIKQLCAENKVKFLDFTDMFMKYKAEEITYMPVDGHLREKGAQLVAEAMGNVIRDFGDTHSNKTYTDAERPKVFGDFTPGLDEIRDGGKNIPYRIKINSQGLRMDFDLKFPKKKPRVLLIGDSGFFFAFLDNDKTGTAKIQAMFPDKEIVNAANWGYSIDDYVTQWNERTKYTEPDIVLLQSTGDDIADQFFSHRLRYSRHPEKIKPTELEKKYYEQYAKSVAAKGQ